MNIALVQGTARPMFTPPRWPRLTRWVLKRLGVNERLLDLHVLYDGGGIAVVADPKYAPNARCVSYNAWTGEVHRLVKLEVTP